MGVRREYKGNDTSQPSVSDGRINVNDTRKLQLPPIQDPGSEMKRYPGVVPHPPNKPKPAFQHRPNAMKVKNVPGLPTWELKKVTPPKYEMSYLEKYNYRPGFHLPEVGERAGQNTLLKLKPKPEKMVQIDVIEHDFTDEHDVIERAPTPTPDRDELPSISSSAVRLSPRLGSNYSRHSTSTQRFVPSPPKLLSKRKNMSNSGEERLPTVNGTNVGRRERRHR